MSKKRRGSKKLLGAGLTPQLWDSIDTWLARNRGQNQTTFLLHAVAEKLRREGIDVKDEDVFRDDRERKPVNSTTSPIRLQLPNKRRGPQAKS
jgi:hypothetical protein